MLENIGSFLQKAAITTLLLPAAAHYAAAAADESAPELQEAAQFLKKIHQLPLREEPRVTPYIVGGSAVPAEQQVYQVKLFVTDPEDPARGTFGCTGAMITPDIVLTAAHCVDQLTTDDYWVRIGGREIFSGTDHSVQEQWVHPGWDRSELQSGPQNDIAILKLSHRTRGVPLLAVADEAVMGQAANAGNFLVASGWGLLSTGGSLANLLQQVELPIVSQATCQNRLGRVNIRDNMICAGPTSGGRGICQGDSGGPMIVTLDNRDYSVGVNSFFTGTQCANSSTYSVGTRTASFYDWLGSIVNTENCTWSAFAGRNGADWKSEGYRPVGFCRESIKGIDWRLSEGNWVHSKTWYN